MAKMITITAPQDTLLQAISGLETKAAEIISRASSVLYHGEAKDKADAEWMEEAKARNAPDIDDVAAMDAALRAERMELIEEYRTAWRAIIKLVHDIRGRDCLETWLDWLWDDRIKSALHRLPREEAARTEATSIVDTLALHAAILDDRAIKAARGIDAGPWTDADRAPLADAVDQLRRRLDISRLSLSHMVGVGEEDIADIEAGAAPSATIVKTLLSIARDAQTMTTDEVYERYCPRGVSYEVPLPARVQMTGDDVRDARGVLGQAWGLGRPLSLSELGRALQLSEGNANKTVLDWERGKGPTGPAATAIQAWLDSVAAGNPVKPRGDFTKPRGRPPKDR